MRIVVFGSDNSGKTTLCDMLASEYNLKRIKPLGPAKKEDQIEYLKNLLQDRVIFDRFPPIEEIVCGNIFRGVSNFSEEEMMLNLSNVDLIIFCKPKTEVILNWGEREQMAGVKENIIELIKGYKDLFNLLHHNGFPVMMYDWQKECNYKKILNKLNEVDRR